MATGKVFYWLKLRTDFYTNNEAIDFLMSKKQGAEYVVLYQMLCLKCINTNGELAAQIGEIIIPYDVDKIQRDCKYFSRDTIIVALQLFKSLGLVYENSNNCLQIANFGEMVGSVTDWAEQKQRQRNKKALEAIDTNDTVDNVHENVHTEIRDKSIEIRDKSIDKDITLSIDKVCSTKVQPVMEEWNKLNLQKVIAINSGTKRQKLLNARLKEYGLEKVLEAIRIIDKSSFLKGQNKDGWIITFDWFLKPSNFIKVLEGNYTDKESENKSDGSTKGGGTDDNFYTELYTTLCSEGSE